MKKQALHLFLGATLCSLLFTPCSSSAQVPSYVPTNGLLGWWPFNGNANDESGNGNHGTVNGATLTFDRFGQTEKAYDFNSDLIRVNNNSLFNLNSGFTLHAWININILSSGENAIISKYQNFDDSYSMHIENLKPTIQVADAPANWTTCEDETNIAEGTWINIISSFDTISNELKLYIDGVLIHQCIYSSTIAVSTADLVFGAFSDGYNNFNGSLDDIGIWDHALTQQEITALYQGCAVTANATPSTAITTNGANAQFTTPAISGVSYQWQSNPANYGWSNVPNNASYAGATTNTLTVSNVQLANHQQPFRVIATDGTCTDTSNVAYIEVADTCITNVTVYDTIYTTVTDTLIINTTLSLAPPNDQNTILIYPNPTSDHITIDNGNYSAMAGYELRIENNAGQQVFQSAINQAQFYLDLSTWTGNGLYFVHLIDPSGATVTVRKIVLQ